MSKLDEILSEFGYQDEYHQADQSSVDSAASDIKYLMLELIGEYETKGRQPEGTAEDWKARGRDELRRQLRRQIEAL